MFGPQILQVTPVDPVLEALRQADAIVGIQLLATLGGLTLTAATFLLAGPLTNLRNELDDVNAKRREAGRHAREVYEVPGQEVAADEAAKKAMEVYLPRQQKLASDIGELEDGGTYLFWAFYVFLSDILAVAISDSALQVYTSDLRTEAVDVGLTGGLLTVGLVLLFQGARRIKHYYLRTSKIPFPGT